MLVLTQTRAGIDAHALSSAAGFPRHLRSAGTYSRPALRSATRLDVAEASSGRCELARRSESGLGPELQALECRRPSAVSHGAATADRGAPLRGASRRAASNQFKIITKTYPHGVRQRMRWWACRRTHRLEGGMRLARE